MEWFFTEEYEYTILENKTLEEIEQETENAQISLPDTRAGRWAKYATLKGAQAGLNFMYSINFGYNISSIVADMGIDAGTDIYFKLEMYDKIFDIFEQVRKEYDDEKEVIKHFFNETLEFYKNEAKNYEKTVYRIALRLSDNDMKILRQAAPTPKKAIFKLMDEKEIDNNKKLVYEELTNRVDINLTWSEYEIFDDLEGDTPGEKVRLLIRR